MQHGVSNSFQNQLYMDAYDSYQLELAQKTIYLDDNFSKPINYVAGFDVYFDDSGMGQAALVVLDWDTLQPVWSHRLRETSSVEYCPGYLGIREAPYAEKLFEILRSKAPEFQPQVTFVDGCGRYHPRFCGSATQIGVELDICTIGVSKSFLQIDGLVESDYINEDKTDRRPRTVKLASGEVIASALYPSPSKHPIFVSVGHGITLETAVELVQKSSKRRLPEPIRLADDLSRFNK